MPLLFAFWKVLYCKLATGEISIFLLVSVADETGLKIALSEIPKTGFLVTRSYVTVNKETIFKFTLKPSIMSIVLPLLNISSCQSLF